MHEAELKPLTRRQHEVLSIIIRETHRRGMAPTFRELMPLLGVASSNAVADNIRPLLQRGYLTNEPGKARSLKVSQAVLQPKARCVCAEALALLDAGDAAGARALLHEQSRLPARRRPNTHAEGRVSA